jgi:hypothetical protein
VSAPADQLVASLDAVLALFRAQGFAEMLVRFESHGDTETATVLSRRG